MAEHRLQFYVILQTWLHSSIYFWCSVLYILVTVRIECKVINHYETYTWQCGLSQKRTYRSSSAKLNFLYLAVRFFFRLHLKQVFFKENVRNPMWTCRDPISLIIGTRFSLILGTHWYFLIVRTRFSILGTRIGSLKRLKKPNLKHQNG